MKDIKVNNIIALVVIFVMIEALITACLNINTSFKYILLSIEGLQLIASIAVLTRR